MPARSKGARILPPEGSAQYPAYPHYGGWRFITCGADGTKTKSQVFPTKARALQARLEHQKVIDGVVDVTVDQALEEYTAYLRDDGWETGPIQDMIWSLRKLLPDGAEMLEALTPKRCLQLYEDLRTRITPKSAEACAKAGGVPGHEPGSAGCLCKRYAPDSQRNCLARGRMLLKWAAKKGFVKENHFAAIEGVGRRKKRKADQLRVDEARRWLDAAHHLISTKGEEGAVAAMIAMTTGLRVTNIVELVARDIDDEGTRIVLDEAKTEASEGSHDIPDELQPYLRALKEGKSPEASLWSAPHWRDWVRKWVARICVAAGVKRITAHGARRTFMSAAYVGGEQEVRSKVAAAGGHTSFEGVTATTYMDPSALRRGMQRRAMKVLRGGRKPPGERSGGG